MRHSGLQSFGTTHLINPFPTSIRKLLWLFIVVASAALGASPVFAGDCYLAEVGVWWTEEGAAQSELFTPGGPYTIRSDAGTDVRFVIFRVSAEQKKVVYCFADFDNGVVGNCTSPSISPRSPEYLAGPSSTLIWCFVDTAGCLARFNVVRLATQSPDLVLEECKVDGSVAPNRSFRVGDQISLQTRVRNNGLGEAAESRVAYYADDNGCARDDLIDDDAVRALDPGEASNESDTWTIPPRYSGESIRIVFAADYENDVEEEAEGNNSCCVGPFTILPALEHPEIRVRQGSTDIPDNGAFDFGTAPADTTLTRTFTIINDGDENLTIGTINVTGPFVRTGSVPTVVAPHSSAVFNIQWQIQEGSNSGEASFSTNDSDENPFNFSLSGQGACVQLPTIQDVLVFDRVDSDSDTYASQIDLELFVASPCSDRTLSAEVWISASATPKVIGPFLARKDELTVATCRLNVTRHITHDLHPDAYDITIRLLDAQSQQLFDTHGADDNLELADQLLESGSDIVDVSDRLPHGKWTVLIHGLSDAPYEVLTSTGTPPCGFGYDCGTNSCQDNWMWRLADTIRKASSLDGSGDTSNVLIRTMDANSGVILNENGQPIQGPTADPDHHQVLLVDWAGVSNLLLVSSPGIEGYGFWIFQHPSEGIQGDDGYAEATADAVFALLHRFGVSSDIHAVVGYSRGAVVATELSQRLLLNATLPSLKQMIFLDGEGSAFIEDHLPSVYTDAAWNGWSWPGLIVDNYYQGQVNTLALPGDWLGGDSLPGGRSDYDLDDTPDGTLGNAEYIHERAHEYFTTGDQFDCGVGHDKSSTSGVFVRNQQLVTLHTPIGNSTITDDPATVNPPGALEIFNGDFDFVSPSLIQSATTAGWWYHGGSPGLGLPESTEILGEIVKEEEELEMGGGMIHGFALKLEPGQYRRHNWMVVPKGAHSITLDAIASESGFAELTVEWWSDLSAPVASSSFIVSSEAETAIIVDIPAEQLQSSCLLVVRNTSASGRGTSKSAVLLDNLSWTQEPAPHSCDADLTGDGMVDAADLARVLSLWGQEDHPKDLDGISPINARDLARLLSVWGVCN